MARRIDRALSPPGQCRENLSGPCIFMIPLNPLSNVGVLLERFPITWTHVSEKESLKFKDLDHAGIEKVEQLFRDML